MGNIWPEMVRACGPARNRIRAATSSGLMNFFTDGLAIAESISSDKLNGIPGSLGIVEGPVRVLRSEKDLPLLQPGELLAAPITALSWAAAFAVAKRVRIDGKARTVVVLEPAPDTTRATDPAAAVR